MMEIEIREEPISTVGCLGAVPISFEVDRVFDVIEADGAIRLVERGIDVPYAKDYDQIPGEGPLNWAGSFNIRKWGFLAARSAGKLVGGAVIAFDTPGVRLLEGRSDLAALWDFRVLPDCRGRGIGMALLRAVEKWARARRCRELRIETQNINVPASRLYERLGCSLESVDRHAYPAFPDEIRLHWRRKLPARRCVSRPDSRCSPSGPGRRRSRDRPG